ncbi:dihydrofolate reductase family protein [Brachybacterium sp. FME24]|uniref:dihydrofolate reductase family protein n=1 Tax=Brachybacterium sp. FME24 TaxID=2742605 RepID=UPI0018666BA8|nr:dihydrofolate reductase family protein [Brachybacterium sp. FME24]
MRELVYYVAVSLDGYIAGPDDQVEDFLYEGDHMTAILEEFADTVPTHVAEMLGLEVSTARFGTVLMGANTYAIGLPEITSPYQHLEQIVVTHQDRREVDGVTFTSADPVELVRDLKHQEGGDIWLCGGGRLADQVIGEIDRLIVKHNPVLFGAGRPLFAPGAYDPAAFDLVRSRSFDSGVMFTEHARRRPTAA